MRLISSSWFVRFISYVNYQLFFCAKDLRANTIENCLQDNPLSALDQHVGQQIFDYGIKKLLLRSGRTVIMVTNKLELLSAAHQVLYYIFNNILMSVKFFEM